MSKVARTKETQWKQLKIIEHARKIPPPLEAWRYNYLPHHHAIDRTETWRFPDYAGHTGKSRREVFTPTENRIRMVCNILKHLATATTCCKTMSSTGWMLLESRKPWACDNVHVLLLVRPCLEWYGRKFTGSILSFLHMNNISWHILKKTRGTLATRLQPTLSFWKGNHGRDKPILVQQKHFFGKTCRSEFCCCWATLVLRRSSKPCATVLGINAANCRHTHSFNTYSFDEAFTGSTSNPSQSQQFQAPRPSLHPLPSPPALPSHHIAFP